MIALGEIIYGGVGSGIYGMLLFVILAVFIAGLMVGRTPEYLGKKTRSQGSQDGDARHSDTAADRSRLDGCGFGAPAGGCLDATMQARTASRRCSTLYVSQTGNNGSAFAGLTANTLWYNTTGGCAMLIGRYFVIIPVMAIAGSLVEKKTVPASAGTFPTHGGLFVGLLVGVILITGGLIFFPAFALGPIVEQSRDDRGHRVLTGFTSESSRWKPHIFASGCRSLRWLDPKIVLPAIGSAFVKLDPRTLIKNPVMFVLEIVTALTTVILIRDLITGGGQTSPSSSRSSCGCGSPCCSPISRKPSPKVAARRRPKRLRRTAHGDTGKAVDRRRPEKLQADHQHQP